MTTLRAQQKNVNILCSTAIKYSKTILNMWKNNDLYRV